jgi:trehalose/maltose hydrolase-like predicted phosphorylase
MTFYNLRTSKIINMLQNLGIKVDEKTFLKNNFDYYYPRTSHGSTLSRVVHAALTNEMGLKADS